MSGYKRVIDRDDLIPGNVFYSVHYRGPASNIPIIETFVFVGKNLLDQVTKDTWYFQYAESYCTKGHFSRLPQEEWEAVLFVDEDSAPVMFNIEELAQRLNELGNPSCRGDFT